MYLPKLTTVAAGLVALMVAAPGIAMAADPMGVDDGTAADAVDPRRHAGPRRPAGAGLQRLAQEPRRPPPTSSTDDYQTKIGAAAAANGLPDLFSADVVFMPNWTSAGLFQDITDRINGMPGIDKVAQAGIDVGTWDGKKYGMPFIADLSVWMWNKKLFKQAGLDPEKGPTTLEEFAADARAVAKLGNGVSRHLLGRQLRRLRGVHLVPDRLGRRPGHHERRRHQVARQQRRVEVDLQDLPRHGRGRHGADARHRRPRPAPTWTSYFPKGIIGVQPMPATQISAWSATGSRMPTSA